MPPDAVEVPPGVSPSRRKPGAVLPLSKLRLVGLADLDGRTSATKRARTLARALTEELGGQPLTATQGAAIERAATMVALAEDLRTRRLAGDETVSLEDLTRVDASADRAVRRLGIKPREKPHVSLRDQLLQEAEAKEQATVTDNA